MASGEGVTKCLIGTFGTLLANRHAKYFFYHTAIFLAVAQLKDMFRLMYRSVDIIERTTNTP